MKRIVIHYIPDNVSPDEFRLVERITQLAHVFEIKTSNATHLIPFTAVRKLTIHND